MSDEKEKPALHRPLGRARAALDRGAAAASEMPRQDEPPAESETPETGGPEGPDPTRYGDWERKGRCIDF